jgi:hypothetical protein
MSRDGTNRIKSKYWWEKVEQQYGTSFVPNTDPWFSDEWLLWKTTNLPAAVLKRGSQRKMRNVIGKENPHRTWSWDELMACKKHDVHRWERHVGKRRAILEQLMESESL